jgi:starch synthase (maltosyl-transferring)
MTSPTPLPSERPSRVVVEVVRPLVDGGIVSGQGDDPRADAVLADVFADGHDVVDAAVAWRHVDANGRAGEWTELPMAPLGNDRFGAWIVPDRLGRLEYDVVGWIDHLESWRRGVVKKIDAGIDVSVELLTGARLVAAVVERGSPSATTRSLGDHRLLDTLRLHLLDGDHSTLDDDHWTEVFARSSRSPVGRLPEPVPVDVDPLLGAFGAWYEFFPRSSVDARIPRRAHCATRSTGSTTSLRWGSTSCTCRRSTRSDSRTARVATTRPEPVPDDVGSPWAIIRRRWPHRGAPDLGTVDDVTAFADACRERGMELALDIAFQCSPTTRGSPSTPSGSPPRRRHDPVRREPAEEVPGHLPDRLRDRRLAGALAGARRRLPLLDRRGACGSSGSTTPTPRRSRSGSGARRIRAEHPETSSWPRRSPVPA